MKTIIPIILCTLLSVLTSFAQVSLPYYSGFDNTSEQTGWMEYKKAATTFSHWGYASANEFSDPNCISHDYSPSTGISLTDNWFVSPGFSLSEGGSLDSIRYMFSGFSVPEVGDTVALYLLNGSQDPALASSKMLLFDFRGTEYNADLTYRIQESIDLPAYDGLAYLAIRYRNTDCSSKWLTVHFDNVALSGGTVGISEIKKEANQIIIFPNPASDLIDVQTEENIASVDIFNITGVRIKSFTYSPLSKSIDVSGLSKGIYLVRFNTSAESFVKRMVIE